MQKRGLLLRSEKPSAHTFIPVTINGKVMKIASSIGEPNVSIRERADAGLVRRLDRPAGQMPGWWCCPCYSRCCLNDTAALATYSRECIIIGALSLFCLVSVLPWVAPSPHPFPLPPAPFFSSIFCLPITVIESDCFRLPFIFSHPLSLLFFFALHWPRRREGEESECISINVDAGCARQWQKVPRVKSIAKEIAVIL